MDQLNIVLELVAFAEKHEIMVPEPGDDIFFGSLPVGLQVWDESILLL